MAAPNMHPNDIQAWMRSHAPSAQLSADSRRIRSGDIFFAYPGDESDGRDYIAQAIANGARAVIHEADGFDWKAEWQVPHLAVSGLKKAAGSIANAWYGQPDAGMHTIAVTGTNGKTSCTQWLGAALSRLGEPSAVIGTLGLGLYRRGEHGGFNATGYTTPDAVSLQRALAGLRADGARALAIEASSIGLDQGRMNGMHVDTAVFTNFSRDHLDYHADMAAYEAAKLALFDWPGLRHAVVNLDDEAGRRLAQRLRASRPDLGLIAYSLEARRLDGATCLHASDIRSSQGGTLFHLDSPFGAAQLKLQLVGQFNVSNVLAVLGALLARGIGWKEALGAMESLTPVPGRMEQLGGDQAPLVVIDYAHTPDALLKALSTLRQVAQQRGGKLWCVFGCGGDRDAGKRPQMGGVSMLADHVIVTSDNPRNEEPATILAQILSGFSAERMAEAAPQVIEDRAAAILWAVRHAAKPDVVLLAGKGHEGYQEIKGKKLPFLDADHASLALAARVTMKGAMQ